jgi:hypothetical protein
MSLPPASGVWSGATRRVTPGPSGVYGRGVPREAGATDMIGMVLLFDDGTVAGFGMEPLHEFTVKGWWGESDVLKPPVRELGELDLWRQGDEVVRLHLVAGEQESTCHLWRVESALSALSGFYWRETG